MSVGEYLRRCALGRRITAKTDTKLIMELQRLGGLQKHLFNQGRGSVSDKFSKEYSGVLVAIRRAIIGIDMGLDPFAEERGNARFPSCRKSAETGVQASLNW
ncbi:plasmid mobilization protein MobA [Rahnella ecdela]|uniref:plasmid mobilization protein MobA n=1 Tax=Rahnella ecdela TaxID=2816250 RepID=UPI0030842478